MGGAADIAVAARIVAATNRDLEAEVQGGRFREDLYYRLNVIQLRMPPLRERRDDIAAFLRVLPRAVRGRAGQADAAARPEATALLLGGARWPGNVRELANVVERAVTLSDESVIGPAALPPALRGRGRRPRRRWPAPPCRPTGSTCRPTSTPSSGACWSRRWSAPAA